MTFRRCSLNPGARRVAALLVGGFAALALLSQGLQIVLTPITLPTMWWLARGSSRGIRLFLGTVSVLTMIFVGWFAAYMISEEKQPLIWVLPVVSSALTVLLFARTGSRSSDKRQT
jgi:hypothetical protein